MFYYEFLPSHIIKKQIAGKFWEDVIYLSSEYICMYYLIYISFYVYYIVTGFYTSFFFGFLIYTFILVTLIFVIDLKYIEERSLFFF